MSVAQNEAGRFEMVVRKPSGITSAVDANNNFAYFLYSNAQYHAVFFNSEKKQTGSIVFNKPKEVRAAKPMAMTLIGDNAYVYFYDEKNGYLGELMIQRASGQHLYKTLTQLPYQQKFLKAFSQEEHFYLLSVTHGRNEVVIWKAKQGKVVQQVHAVDLADLYKRLSTGNSYLNEEPNGILGIDRVRTDIENNVKSAQAVKKVYVQNEIIYLTFDDPDYTHLIIINTIENTNTYKKLKFTLQDEATNDKKQGNSFLCDNLLFRLTINTHQLNISVINIDSMVQVTSLNAYPNTEIDFKNGPMVQEGSNEKDKIIATTDQFIKKVLSASSAIAVNKRDSVWIMEIGGFESYQVNNGPGGMGMGGSGFSVGMGMGMGMGYGGGYYGGYPGYYGGGYPGYYGGYPGYYNSYSTQVRSYYLYSMLNEETLQPTPGIVPISLRERINNFQELMFKDNIPELVRIVNLPDDILVGYYVGKTANFRIYQFVK
ncbi:MAG: hypothetical protein U0U66_11365 [Cytophagaceae bacterium]